MRRIYLPWMDIDEGIYLQFKAQTYEIILLQCHIFPTARTSFPQSVVRHPSN